MDQTGKHFRTSADKLAKSLLLSKNARSVGVVTTQNSVVSTSLQTQYIVGGKGRVVSEQNG